VRVVVAADEDVPTVFERREQFENLFEVKSTRGGGSSFAGSATQSALRFLPCPQAFTRGVAAPR